MHMHAVQLQYFMAQEAPEASVACSSSTSPTNMWDHQMHAPSSASFPSWSPYAAALLAGGAPTHVSASFGADSSSPDMRLSSEHVESHVWNQVLLSTGAHGSTKHGESNGYRENFLDLLASKSVTSEMFDDVDPACDYLKGMDRSNLEGYSSLNSLDSHHVASAPMAGCVASNFSQMKYEIASSPLYLGNGVLQGSMSCMPCYDHDVKEGNQHQEFGAPMTSFLQQINPSSVGIQSSLDYSVIGIDKICPEGDRMVNAPFGMRNLPDFASFSGYRSTVELMSTKPYMKCVDLSDNKAQEQEILSARTSSSGSGAANDGKKRKSEERSEGVVKKSNQEISTTSSLKLQAPKVKLGEKIAALQQIVSPFGKTDTASVLFETIKYIKFLHEQVQLLSEPYMKASTNKGHVPWGGAETEEKAEVEHDLRSRGLCLIPVSWTPQIYRDNSVPDYWTPMYRSCLYR